MRLGIGGLSGPLNGFLMVGVGILRKSLFQGLERPFIFTLPKPLAQLGTFGPSQGGSRAGGLAGVLPVACAALVPVPFGGSVGRAAGPSGGDAVGEQGSLLTEFVIPEVGGALLAQVRVVSQD